VRDTVTVEARLAGTVGFTERLLVIDSDLVLVTETVTDRVANRLAGTVGFTEREPVRDTVTVGARLAGTVKAPERLLVIDSDLVLVTETVTDRVANRLAGTVGFTE